MSPKYGVVNKKLLICNLARQASYAALTFEFIILHIDIKARFTHAQYTGSEATGFVMVTLELVGGTSSNPFSVTVTPWEQSPVSAEGYSVMCMITC